MSSNDKPGWVSRPPVIGDIVTCLYPNDPKGNLRPCLVLGVAKGSKGGYAIHVAYGTKQLDKNTRGDIDLIVETGDDVAACGIALPTRFDLENTAAIVWEPPDFNCWHGRYTPVLGALPKHQQIDCAYKMRAIQSKIAAKKSQAT